MNQRSYERCEEYIERINLALTKLDCLNEVARVYNNGRVNFYNSMQRIKPISEMRRGN